jgi:hypothetical protein
VSVSDAGIRVHLPPILEKGIDFLGASAAAESTCAKVAEISPNNNAVSIKDFNFGILFN